MEKSLKPFKVDYALKFTVWYILHQLFSTVYSTYNSIVLDIICKRQGGDCSTENKAYPPATWMYVWSLMYNIVYVTTKSLVSTSFDSSLKLISVNCTERRAESPPYGIGELCQPFEYLFTESSQEARIKLSWYIF